MPDKIKHRNRTELVLASLCHISGYFEKDRYQYLEGFIKGGRKYENI